MNLTLQVFPIGGIQPAWYLFYNMKMKELNVKKVSALHVPVQAVPALLDQEKVAFQPVDTVNWEQFPYRPSVQFRIAHT